MNKVIDLGFIGDKAPLVLTEVVDSAIVEAGMRHNAPSHHFEVTTIWGEPLTLNFLQERDVTLDMVMSHCFNKREGIIHELFDGGSCTTFMLKCITGDRVQVRTAFVHKDIVHLVDASQLWPGKIPMLLAA